MLVGVEGADSSDGMANEGKREIALKYGSLGEKIVEGSVSNKCGTRICGPDCSDQAARSNLRVADPQKSVPVRHDLLGSPIRAAVETSASAALEFPASMAFFKAVAIWRCSTTGDEAKRAIKPEKDQFNT